MGRGHGIAFLHVSEDCLSWEFFLKLTNLPRGDGITYGGCHLWGVMSFSFLLLLLLFSFWVSFSSYHFIWVERGWGMIHFFATVVFLFLFFNVFLMTNNKNTERGGKYSGGPIGLPGVPRLFCSLFLAGLSMPKFDGFISFFDAPSVGQHPSGPNHLTACTMFAK